jgi:Sec-independent protein translocase protein TatA
MDILGVGPLELAFLLILAIIILGPAEMLKLGKSAGKFIYKIQTSDMWASIKKVSREISTLPYKLAREAGLEEIEQQLKDQTIGVPFTSNLKETNFSSWTTNPEEKPIVDKETDKSEDTPPEK